MLKDLIFLIYTSMDKQLLNALDNLSEALVMIADALAKKDEKSNSATTNALSSGDFSKQIKEINTGILSIKKDTKKILENQQTILEMSKKKDTKKGSLVEDVGEDKKAESNIKKGVTTILLIAVGVLAIGLAFKLVGKIDFLSVIALSLAMVLVSIAFEKIAKLDISTKDAKNTSLTMVIMAIGVTMSSWILKLVASISITQAMTAILIAGMFGAISFGIVKLIKALDDVGFDVLAESILFLPYLLPAIALGITLSSWVLNMVTPISFMQALTSILIAGMFTVIAFGIAKLIKAMGKVGMADIAKSILYLPLLLPAIALAIATSSWVLKMVTPISFMQALTSILIAGMFTVIAYGIAKLVGAFKGLKEDEIGAAVIGLPLLLPAMALAIAVSSWFLRMVMPILPMQALTAILIAALFVVLSYGMEKIAKSVSKMDYKDIVKIPVFFTLMALAISLSAFIFSKYIKEIDSITFMMMLKILVIGAAMGIVMVIVAFAMKIMGKITLSDAVKVPIMFTLLAVAIALSAAVFSNYKKEIEGLSLLTIIKILIFSVSLAIAVVVMAMAILLVNKIGGYEEYVTGGLAILIIATTIMLASLILENGNYDSGKYPDWKWSLGVGLSLFIFGVATLLLGVLILETAGLGLAALAIGAVGILLIAGTIVATSHILSKGKYDKYPGFDWSIGVGLSMLGFGIAMGTLGVFILGSLGLGIKALELGGEAVLLIAQTIVDTSFILKKGDYTGGPTKDWAEGISLALGAFAPVYEMLTKGGIMDAIFGSGPTPDQFSEGIRTISKGIVDAAGFFAGTKGFEGGPSKKWAEGVGTAIAAFAPVYAALNSGGFFSAKVTPDDMKAGILTISDGIIAAAGKFNDPTVKFDVTKVPSVDWGKNVSAAIMAFAPVFDFMKGSSMFKSNQGATDDMVYGINSVAQAIVTVAKRFASVKSSIWSSYPKNEWIESVKTTVGTFVEIVNSLKDTDWIELGSVSRVAQKLVSTAQILAKGNFTKKIDPNFIKNLSTNVLGFATLAKKLTEINKGSGLIKSMFGMDPVSQTANSMLKLANAYDKMANALKKFGGALASIDGKKVDVIRRLTGNMAVLAAMNEQAFSSMMTTLESKGSVFAKLVDADKTKTGPVVGEGKGKKGTGVIDKAKPKGKYGETYQQLDIMIDLLNNINRNTSALDDFLAKQGLKSDNLLDLTMKK